LSAHEYHMQQSDCHAHGAHGPEDRAGIVDVGLCVFGSLSGYMRRRKFVFLWELAATLLARRRYRAALRAFEPDALLAFNPLGVLAPVLDDFVAYSARTGAPVNAYVSDHWVAAWPSGNPLWPLLSRFRQHGRRSVRGAAKVAHKVLSWIGLVPNPLPLLDRYFYCSDFILRISRENSTAIAD